MSLRITAKDALLVTDLQQDFLPGGSLAVDGGDQVVAPLRALIRKFRESGARVYLSRDWHPADHCSFEAQGGPWPPHCIQNSSGAGFSPELQADAELPIISKATESNREAYSAFEGTDFELLLGRDQVERLFIGGLTTEYCVLNTVIDARKLGFEVVVLEDTIRAISEGDSKRAKEDMHRCGATFALSQELLAAEVENPAA